jgi:hypothetical protein
MFKDTGRTFRRCLLGLLALLDGDNSEEKDRVVLDRRLLLLLMLLLLLLVDAAEEPVASLLLVLLELGGEKRETKNAFRLV